jgi:hypothetical protein
MAAQIRFSPLDSSFNGFFLGAFLGGAQQNLAATRYRSKPLTIPS